MLDAQSAPLAGQRILVTRTREQASTFSERLRMLGAVPVEFPTIRIVPPQDWHELDAALHRLYVSDGSGYDWLVLTSANGVRICCDRLRELGYEPRELQTQRRVRIATIGPATAEALAPYGLTADLLPDAYIAEGVAAALLEEARRRGADIAGQRFLLARAAEARKVLADELRRAGALVDDVAAYFTVPVAEDDARGRTILELLLASRLDFLTFTSSSTVRNFVAWLRSCEQEAGTALQEQIMSTTRIASIGPVTSQTARELGLRVDCEARSFTIEGLVQAIIDAVRSVKT